MLQNDFVPVAIDQAYQRRQDDTEGAFYRRIASQGPRSDFVNGTSQGFYIAVGDGELLLYNNNRNPQRLRRLMREALEELAQRGDDAEVEAIEEEEVDARFSPTPPEGGLVVRVRAKVVSGYEPTDDAVAAMFQESNARRLAFDSPPCVY